MSLYEQLMEACHKEFCPQTEHERFLVQTMAHSRWKLDRLQQMEVKLFDLVLADVATPAQTQMLASLQKYTAAAERSYYKALREFYAGRKAGIKAENQAIMAQIRAIANAPLPTLADMPDFALEPKPARTVAAKTAAAPRRP